MTRYMALFSLTGDALARSMENPEDRRAPVAKAMEAAGGKLIDYYWMFGQYDGFAVLECPDSATAAAVSLAVTSSGAFKHFETHELIPADDLVRILNKAKSLRPAYRGPGQQ